MTFRELPATSIPTRVLVCGLFTLLAFVNLSPAQEPKKKFEITVPYDGVELFARLLDDAGLTPVKTLDELLAGPVEQSILIVFGDPAPLEALEARPGGVAGFLDRGGAILVASERRFPFEKLPSLGLDRAEIHIGDMINFDPTRNFRDHPQCPRIAPKDSPNPKHKILAGLEDDIVTNCPGCLRLDEGLQSLLNLPPGTAPERAIQRGLIAPFIIGNIPYMATAPDRPLVVIAGHGLFMNCLAVRKDIGNAALAVNVIRWLQNERRKGDPNVGKRTRVCLLHESEPVKDFKLPLAGPPRPPIPSIDAMNRILDVIQNEQLVQKLIDETIGPEPIIRTMLYLATLGLLFYGAKKFFQSRWTLESTPSAIEGGAKVKPPLVIQRQRELARKNELGEPAQALARDWFQSYAGLVVRPGQPLGKLTYHVRAGALQKFKLSRHLDSLWALAGDPHPRGWTSKRLHSLTAILEELSLAVIAGEIEFGS